MFSSRIIKRYCKKNIKDQQYCSSFCFHSHVNPGMSQIAPTGTAAPSVLLVRAFLVSKSTIMLF